ncbi:MAG TPA: HD domain-containing protein [Candidatus Paceibacterota bacterium]|nr:HD domain-containing protein [Candidatus Paceibacterota bacterium]
MANEPKIKNTQIPEYVTHVTKTLQNSGFEVFLVGGCVRDLIMKREPNDWDITTNAKPEQIIPLFEKTVYENNFGTVGICMPKIDENSQSVTHETKSKDNFGDNTVTCVTEYNIIEVTPYRIEAKYSDFRHPDEVKFSDNLEDDLKRRDFTINSLAYNVDKGQIVDLYKGQDDIKDKVIRAVGDANNRFNEDALRMIRAIRFSTQLDFALEYNTMQAIVNNADLIKNISRERIRDEFIKIINTKNPSMGIAMLSKLGLLKHIIPELEEGIGCIQGGAHIYDVFEHLLQALEHSANKGFSTEVRLAALFHDIGKPKSRRPGEKKEFTFYGHEVVGAKMTQKIMERLKFPKKTTDLVVSLIRNHMFFSDTEQISLSAVRRIVQRVGKEHVWELMNVRECDRVGMKKVEAPYRLRKYHAMIEEVLRDPISVGQLAIDGNTLIQEMAINPGPRMGWILSALLEEVLDDPTKNTKEHLAELVKSLNMLGDDELKTLGERGKEKKEELEQKEINKLHTKHGV